ncbi:hypothetical protein N656DRAFT_768548 [Canariomyces notabilis]|uniref:Uncharacterized protein n=1 Tax=Canariomyces notabilis TaxID=2074819 RepID=A0AAN6TDG7_9PEZI|nr:hypothetical protein N656DRAFT_768548 [Canariomyces arenarius]
MFLFAHLVLVCLWACQVLGTPVLPESKTEPPALRYVPGSAHEASANISYDPQGVFVLGVDGVLRSFAPNISVVDYRQLDPDQVQELATGLARQARSLGVDVALGIQYLLEHPDIDGRLITDANAILTPGNPLNLPHPDYSTGATSPPRVSRDLSELLNGRQPAPCPATCNSLTDCIPVGCFACFFPGGPGSVGICFTG